MKYWICIDSDGTQCINIGTITKYKEKPDDNYGSFLWKEISE